MKDPIITYRGASIPLSELYDQPTSQLEQQQGTREVQYRGASAEVALNARNKTRKVTISYRGATTEIEM